MLALLAHFAIIPVGFSPSFSSFLFRSFRPHFSVQIGGREPDSEDELLLMTEVESLQSQLRKKGETFNEKIENVFMEGLSGKSTSVRIRRWTIRRDQLRKMAEAPHATSGGPAVSLDDTGTRLKADQHVEKAEEKQTKGVQRYRLGGGREQRKKNRRQPRKHSYLIRGDGQPPEMSQIHVDFARLSSTYITSNPLNAQQKILIENFNSSSHATQRYARVATGTPGSGKADNFFNNGYFKMEDLKKIASGMHPMPIALKMDQDGREYSRYEEDGDAGDDTAAAAGGGGSCDTTAVGGGGRDGRDEGRTDAAGGAAAAGGRRADAAAERALQSIGFRESRATAAGEAAFQSRQSPRQRNREFKQLVRSAEAAPAPPPGPPWD